MNSTVWILVSFFSKKVLIFVGLVPVITDNPIIYLMWALAISLGFPYLVLRMFFARVYPLLLKGNPSMTSLTLGSSRSFKYENLATDLSDLSLSSSNCPQNLCQFMCVP